MFAGMIKVQNLLGPGPAVRRHIPNPGRSIAHHQNPFRTAQASAQRLPVQYLGHRMRIDADGVVAGLLGPLEEGQPAALAG